MKKLLTCLALISALNYSWAQELQSRFVSVNNHELHYYQMGESGTPLILLTGYATTSNFWNRKFVDCLAQKHSVYLVDYQGINSQESPPQAISLAAMAKDVNQMVANLKLGKPSLIGWSMGGGVALQASFESASQYQYLFLLAPLVPSYESGMLITAKAAPAFHSDADVLNYVFGRNLYHYQKSELARYQAQFIDGQVANLFPSPEIINLQGTAIHNWMNSPEAVSAFAKSQVPATFFIPEHDAIINQKVAQTAITKYSNYELIKVKNAGHAPVFQQPLLVCQKINSALAE